MPIHDPPQYRYGLFDPWDKETFMLINRLAKQKNYPKIVGTKEDKNNFLISLIRTQKSTHDWRNLPKEVVRQIEEDGIIDTVALNQKYHPKIISQDTPEWVTYTEDKIVSDFIDELATRKIEFIGTDAEIVEFIIRFILAQLGHDWQQSIYMIWEMLGEDKQIHLNNLNKELKNFDYCKVFK